VEILPYLVNMLKPDPELKEYFYNKKELEGD